MTIHLVPVAEVDRVWPLLHQGMERACRKARCDRTAVDIYQACRNGAWFLHIVIEDNAVMAGIVTQVTGDVVTVQALCGRHMKRWLPELLVLDLWKTLGVSRAEWGGRVGLGTIIRTVAPNLKLVRQSFELELSHAS